MTTYWLVTLSRYAKSVIVFVVACSWVAGVAAQSELNELPQVVLEHEHGGQVVFLGVIEDGRQLISVDYNGGVYVWDAQTMRQVSTERRVPFSVRTAALIGPRSLLVAGSKPLDFLAIIDLDSNSLPRVLGAAGGETISISAPMADGKLRAVVLAESLIRVLDIDTKGNITERLRNTKTGVSSISLSGDGRFLAIATNEPKLLLLDATKGTILWERQVDRTLTSLSISTMSDVVLGGYDNVFAFTLKRIDQFNLRSGRTIRQIKTDPCSVFQVDVVDADQGFAICGPSITDLMVNMSKGIQTSFQVWSLKSNRKLPIVFAPPQARPGSLGYLPFPAGFTFDRRANRLFIGGGDGSLFAAYMPTNYHVAHTVRLAPVPQVALRFAIGSDPHKLLVVSNLIARNGGKKSKKSDLRQTMRSAIGSATTEHFTENELQEALDPNGTLTAMAIPNELSSWDIDSGASEGSISAPLGYVLDVVPGVDKLQTNTMAVEAMSIPVGGEFEPTILAVSQLSTDENFGLVNRKLVSIDSITGLLKEGIRRSNESRLRFDLSTCSAATAPSNVRLSRGGQLLCIVCLALQEGGSKSGSQDFLHPDYDLLTYWLSPTEEARPARIRFSGTPSKLEVSNDGLLAAVLTYTQTIKSNPEAPGIDNTYSLTIIDTRMAKVLKTIPLSTEPALGKAMQFSPNAKRLYLALGQGIYRYDVGVDDGLVPINLRFERTGSANISAISVNQDGSLMAVARHNGVTDVFQLADLAPVGSVRHTGKTMHQIEFDTGPSQRLVAAAMSGGIELFEYHRGQKIVDLLSYENGEWITVAPDGVFSASIGGELGVTVTDGRHAVGVDQLYDLYFRPDILRRRIAGESADAPAPIALRNALSMPPPLVEASLISDKSSSIVVSISIHDLGGGIGGLRVFHNGKLSHELDATSLQKLATRVRDRSNWDVKIPLPVATGSNEYVISAMNADRSIQSRFAKVSIDRPRDETVTRKAYVLIVGTNSFEQSAFPKLSLAEDSSRKLGEAFRNMFATVVGQQNVIVQDLVGEGSSFASVEQALGALEQQVTPDDIVTLIITTHGKVLPSGEMLAILRDTGADGARALTTTGLISSMNKIQAMTQVLVLDICHAGVVSKRVSEVYQDRFSVFAGRAGIQVLASTSAEEPALGAFKGTTPFAHFLIEGLQPHPESTTRTRSLRSVANKAKDQVEATASRFGFVQVPTIYSFGKEIRFP